MKITILSGNQRRHIYLVKQLAKVASEVHFICETGTLFPRYTKTDSIQTSTMSNYFSKVMAAEEKVFGKIHFLDQNTKTLPIYRGDLNYLRQDDIYDALDSDLFIVFGSSYIKGWLLEFLISKRALNLHIGLSPYYRGTACNVWAVYDGNQDLVGATVHRLDSSLDTGAILFHTIPPRISDDSVFDFTMRSVLSGQEALLARIQDFSIFHMAEVPQDKSKQLRYSRNLDFTDDVANTILNMEFKFENAKPWYPDLILPH